MSKLLLGASLLVLGVGLSACGGSSSGNNNSGHPAAVVNGHDISMAAYNEQFTYKRVLTMEGNGEVDVCSAKIYQNVCQKLKQTALSDLIGEELVREYAQAHGIKISNAEFQARWTTIYNEKYHSNMAVLRALAKRYGVTIGFLQDQVRQEILQEKVMYRLTKNMPRIVPAVRLSRIVGSNAAEIKGIRRLLHSGIPFNRLAVMLDKDKRTLCSQSGCGDLGWLPNSFIPSHNGMTTAPAGTVLGPIASQSAMALFLVEAHSNRYHLTPKQDLAMRQQIFSNWLTQQVQRASVRRYVAV